MLYATGLRLKTKSRGKPVSRYSFPIWVRQYTIGLIPLHGRSRRCSMLRSLPLSDTGSCAGCKSPKSLSNRSCNLTSPLSRGFSDPSSLCTRYRLVRGLQESVITLSCWFSLPRLLFSCLQCFSTVGKPMYKMIYTHLKASSRGFSAPRPCPTKIGVMRGLQKSIARSVTVLPFGFPHLLAPPP